MNCTIYVVKTKALITRVAFDFEYAKSRLSDDAALLLQCS